MSYEQMKNNKVYLSGTIANEPVLTHEAFGEGFYELSLSVKRLSDFYDLIPMTISEKLVGEKKLVKGEPLTVKGQLRSYNKMVEGKSKLLLTVFVRELIDELPDVSPNIIEITGFLCKPPIFRVTPFKREICDLLVAVNRQYNKSDYLPCIAWGRNARFSKDLEVGEKIVVTGRIQSREYQKKDINGETETKIAFEISVSQIQNEKNNIVTNAVWAQTENGEINNAVTDANAFA